MNISQLFETVFGEKLKKESYKMVPHNFGGKVVGKSYCLKCGLIALNNPLSRWATEKGCLNELHPSYRSKLKQ